MNTKEHKCLWGMGLECWTLPCSGLGVACWREPKENAGGGTGVGLMVFFCECLFVGEGDGEVGDGVAVGVEEAGAEIYLAALVMDDAAEDVGALFEGESLGDGVVGIGEDVAVDGAGFLA